MGGELVSEASRSTGLANAGQSNAEVVSQSEDLGVARALWGLLMANEWERFARERNPTQPPLTDLYSTVVDDRT